MTGITGVVESRFYFDPAGGALVGFDTRIEEDVDECAVRFAAPLEFEGRKLPEQLAVSRGGEAWRTLVVEQSDLTPGERPKPEPPKEEQAKGDEPQDNDEPSRE